MIQIILLYSDHTVVSPQNIINNYSILIVIVIMLIIRNWHILKLYIEIYISDKMPLKDKVNFPEPAVS